MPRASSLPRKLSYLNTVRKKLAALASDELNEDMDPSLFQNIFKERIKGLSLDQARKTLQTDHAELQEWLRQAGQEDDRLYFVLGFLLMASESPEKLLEPAAEPPRLSEIQMQFPPEARATKRQHGWKVRWRGFTLFILPSDESSFEHEIQIFNEPVGMYANLISMSVVPVHFDGVRGVKRVEVIPDLGAKHVKYALQVPGGYVTAAILKKGHVWEESIVEKYFSTIQITEESLRVA